MLAATPDSEHQVRQDRWPVLGSSDRVLRLSCPFMNDQRLRAALDLFIFGAPVEPTRSTPVNQIMFRLKGSHFQ